MKSVSETTPNAKIIAIARGIEADDLLRFAEAIYKGGVRLLELPFSPSAPETDAQNAGNIRLLADAFAGKMCIGAGTVLTPEQVELTASAGGCFVISPNTDKTVIERTRALGLVSVPGALTPTEIVAARNYGADLVKLFPAANFGADYVKAITAPLSHIPLLAVGGITPENIPVFREAGVCGFGIGSAIADRTLIQAGHFEKITELARRFTEAAYR